MKKFLVLLMIVVALLVTGCDKVNVKPFYNDDTVKPELIE